MDGLCTKCHKPNVNDDEHTCIDCKNKETEKHDHKGYIIGLWLLIGVFMAYSVAIITIVSIGGVF